MNIEEFVNGYLQEHRHDVLLNPYNGLVEFAEALKAEALKDAVAEVEVGMRGDPIEIILDKYVQRAKGIFPGDKVRVIVCKNED